jgi:NAD(P)H dehydrogenase (quinone)
LIDGFTATKRTDMTIIVTGATGALNGATVDHLLERVPAEEIVVAVRDPAKAHRFADRGVEVRRADYAAPNSLPAAFEGADQLLLVSSSDPKADAVSLHHAATEKLLSDSDVAWTSLRNGFYAHSLNWLLGPWRETGLITVPTDGPVSWTAREDAAEAAAIVLASDGAYDGPTTLTADAAPTFEDIAAIASELTSHEIRFEAIGENEWVAAQVAAGQEEFMARFMLGMYQAAREGFFAGVDPLLGDLLGREPQTVRDLLATPAA